MITIANYLYAISYSKVYDAKQWQAWADKLILENDELDLWIYDVSLKSNFKDLCIVFP